MLELLNAMVADGGAQQLATTMRSMTALSELLADPGGPLFQILDRVPPLLADLNRTVRALPPVIEQAGQTLDSVNGLTTGPDAPIARTLADLQASLADLRRLGDQLSSVLTQTRTPLVGFAQTGLPSLQGLIQDTDRAVSEISRTVRDLRQNPSRFLLGDPAAQGVKLQ